MMRSAREQERNMAEEVTSSASETKYMSFDIFGRLLRSQQYTDGVAYGDDTHPMTYTYNLGGAMIEQTYPSGRVVKNTFDQDGNLSQVQSKKDASHSGARPTFLRFFDLFLRDPGTVVDHPSRAAGVSASSDAKLLSCTDQDLI